MKKDNVLKIIIDIIKRVFDIILTFTVLFPIVVVLLCVISNNLIIDNNK